MTSNLVPVSLVARSVSVRRHLHLHLLKCQHQVSRWRARRRKTHWKLYLGCRVVLVLSWNCRNLVAPKTSILI